MFLAALLAFIPFIQQTQDVVDWLPMSEAAIERTAETSISEFQEGLDHFLAIPNEKRTFDNTVRTWDLITGSFDHSIYSLEAILQIHPEKKVRECLEKTIEKLNNIYLEALTSHPEIYKAFLEVENSSEVDEEEHYYLDQLLNSCREMGMQLSDEDRAIFLQTKQEIFALQSLFTRQIVEDSRVLYVSKEELAGIDEAWIHGLKQNEEGLYELPCNYPTYLTIAHECSNRNIRKAMHDLFMNRAYPNNEEVIQNLIAKQDQLAKILGYESFAAYDLSSQMAGSPQQVKTFLKKVKEKAGRKADFEYAKLFNELPEDIELSSDAKIERFDEAYLLNQYKKRHFSIDIKEIAKYFPFDSTLKGLIEIYEQFFDLLIQEVSHSIPIPDLKALEIKNRSGQLLGIIFLDLFPRAGKNSHLGVCHCLVPPYAPKNKEPYPATSLLLGNFSQPMGNQPALFDHQEVIILFHEFGHAIHNIFAKNQFMNLSGLSVKYDFVEMPSQLLENWLWDPVILKKISSHYQTRKPLPDEIIQNMIRAKNFGIGISTQRSSFLSELSLEFFDKGQDRNPTDIMREVWERELPHVVCNENNHFHASWWHVPSYGPKYYSYLWSKVFSDDLFEKIRQEGLLNPEIGMIYADTVLGKGGGRDPKLLLLDFLEREPSMEPFLSHFSQEEDVNASYSESKRRWQLRVKLNCTTTSKHMEN